MGQCLWTSSLSLGLQLYLMGSSFRIPNDVDRSTPRNVQNTF